MPPPQEEHTWKTAHRRERQLHPGNSSNYRKQRTSATFARPPKSQMTLTGTDLRSIEESLTERSCSSSIRSSSGHSSGASRNGNNNSSGAKSVTSESVDNVFKMLQEDEHVKNCHSGSENASKSSRGSRSSRSTSSKEGSKGSKGTRGSLAVDDLEKEIQAEIGDIGIISTCRDQSNSPPQQAFRHGHCHDQTNADRHEDQNAHLRATSKTDNNYNHYSSTPQSTSQSSEDESEEGGPMIYTNQDDDDDFSQITSSIAGNTIYSHEYMFSSISFPKSRPNGNTHRPIGTSSAGAHSSTMPSLDGTDSRGSSAGSRGSGISQLPPMDEKQSLVMDKNDFERFFGSSPSTGAAQRKTRSRDETDEPINIYHGKNSPSSHIHSHNHFSGHASAISEQQNDDGLSIGDIYSYAPSTMVGDSTINNVHSSSPLIWIYRQVHSLFSTASSNRKKNDDFDDCSIDRDADYFGTMMSADFLSSSPNDVPWKKGNKKRKYLKAFSLVGGFCFIVALIHNGDMGSEADYSMNFSTITHPETGKGMRGAEFNPEDPRIKNTAKSETTSIVKAMAKETKSKDNNLVPLVSKKLLDRSHEGMALPKIFENFADVGDDPTNTIPFYWHVPRAAGATINDIFSLCHHFRVATNIGIVDGHEVDSNLQIMNYEGQQFVNVDISTKEGIQRAIDMGFASSDLTDVAISSLLHDASPLFSPTRKGKMFTFFRHPVDRVVSMFYFMQDTLWKGKETYNKELAEISIESFFLKQLGENNWQVRYLTNQLTKPYVDEEDFKLAKEILRRKALIGLLAEKDESFNRFSKHFGWKPKRGADLECQNRKLQWDWSLRHPHEVEVLEGNRLWKLISGQNSYDIKLYEYAQQLFQEQASLVQ